MICKIIATSVLSLRPNGESSKLERTEFKLDLSSNMIREEYLTKDGKPTKNGSHAITSAFIQGLVGNIHFAHQAGFRDSAEHLRYIISELERGFVRQVEVDHCIMEPID